MSREAAKKIVDLMIKHGAEQNAILAEIQSICADDEFQKYKRMIGQSMGCMLLDVINPIVELYPALKPSHARNRRREIFRGSLGNEDQRDLVGATAARYVQTIV